MQVAVMQRPTAALVIAAIHSRPQAFSLIPPHPTRTRRCPSARTGPSTDSASSATLPPRRCSTASHASERPLDPRAQPPCCGRGTLLLSCACAAQLRLAPLLRAGLPARGWLVVPWHSSSPGRISPLHPCPPRSMFKILGEDKVMVDTLRADVSALARVFYNFGRRSHVGHLPLAWRLGCPCCENTAPSRQF